MWSWKKREVADPIKRASAPFVVAAVALFLIGPARAPASAAAGVEGKP